MGPKTVFRGLVKIFCQVIVRLMTDPVVDALTDVFAKHQAQLNALADSLKARQQAIDTITSAYTDSQTKLAALSQQLSSDTQISDLSTKCANSNQSLSKLVTQAQSLQVPTLPAVGHP